jgi:hypothetical protein
MFPQLNGLKLEADDEFIYVFNVDVVPATDKPDHSTVSIFITNAFIGEDVNPEKRHHQAPEEFRIIRNITGDPLNDIPVLPTHPPDFVPGLQYMQERHNKLQLNPDGFLWPEEEKLAHHLVREQEDGLSWVKEEKGEFQKDFFPPVRILTVPHTPWVYKNIPILPGLHDKLIKIVRDKIVSGAYEPSNAAYRSRWFCVIKRNGSSLRVVHDLHPFNTITIGDVSIPPITEQLVESFGARACYANLDLFVAYDQGVVHPVLGTPPLSRLLSVRYDILAW